MQKVRRLAADGPKEVIPLQNNYAKVKRKVTIKVQNTATAVYRHGKTIAADEQR